MMKKRNIRLTTGQVKEFVSAASRCDFDIDVACESRGHITVDAKSILGVLALNLMDQLVVTYNGYNKQFEDELNRLAPVSCRAGRILTWPAFGATSGGRLFLCPHS